MTCRLTKRQAIKVVVAVVCLEALFVGAIWLLQRAPGPVTGTITLGDQAQPAPVRPYARAGQVVTGLDGRRVCVLAYDIYKYTTPRSDFCHSWTDPGEKPLQNGRIVETDWLRIGHGMLQLRVEGRWLP